MAKLGRPSKHTEEQRATVRRLKEEGSSVRSIAERMGLSRSTVGHILAPTAPETYRVRKYGLSMVEFTAISAAQGQKCKVCRRTSIPLHVDHCHRTGRIRGLLCTRCNCGIGQFREDPRVLARAIDYLLDHEHTERIRDEEDVLPRVKKGT